MYQFHVSIHALPDGCAAGPDFVLAGQRYQTLAVSQEQLATTTFARSFEETLESLASLERMFIEADGSFVWVSSQQQTSWQVDGNLYDHQERLRFVDAKGDCPSDQFDRLLGALGWPATPVMFQLVRAAVFLGEAEFRRHAAWRN